MFHQEFTPPSDSRFLGSDSQRSRFPAPESRPDGAPAGSSQRLYAAGGTRGCRTEPELLYCPGRSTSRAEMASFVNRARSALDS